MRRVSWSTSPCSPPVWLEFRGLPAHLRLQPWEPAEYLGRVCELYGTLAKGGRKKKGKWQSLFSFPLLCLGFSCFPFFLFFLLAFSQSVEQHGYRSWRGDWEFSRKEEDETKERLCLVGRRTLMDNQDGKMGVCAHGDQGARICEGSAGVGEEAGFCWR